MSSLVEKIQAIEKIGAGDLADQTLRKLIHLQLQKYEKHLEEMQRELVPFETQYDMRSDKCRRQFEAGKLEDTADFAEWMSLYDNVLLYQERIETLRTVSEA